jgi:hypothetical protein
LRLEQRGTGQNQPSSQRLVMNAAHQVLMVAQQDALFDPQGLGNSRTSIRAENSRRTMNRSPWRASQSGLTTMTRTRAPGPARRASARSPSAVPSGHSRKSWSAAPDRGGCSPGPRSSRGGIPGVLEAASTSSFMACVSGRG